MILTNHPAQYIPKNEYCATSLDISVIFITDRDPTSLSVAFRLKRPPLI